MYLSQIYYICLKHIHFPMKETKTKLINSIKLTTISSMYDICENVCIQIKYIIFVLTINILQRKTNQTNLVKLIIFSLVYKEKRGI